MEIWGCLKAMKFDLKDEFSISKAVLGRTECGNGERLFGKDSSRLKVVSSCSKRFKLHRSHLNRFQMI
jgi:hypothetical protein